MEFLDMFAAWLDKIFIVIVRGCLRAVEIKLSEKSGLMYHYVHTDETVIMRQMNLEVQEYGYT